VDSAGRLARLCHMSRATMARHFQEKLGRSASRTYWTDIRMMLAAQGIEKGRPFLTRGGGRSGRLSNPRLPSNGPFKKTHGDNTCGLAP